MKDFRDCWIANKNKKDFYLFLVGILINLRRCRLQTKNLEKLIFVNKNWPNDPRIRCKFSSNLLEFLEKHIDFKKELEEFEREFEENEVVEV